MMKSFKAFKDMIAYWKKHPIASKNLSGTILRFMRWQLGSKFLKAPIIWSWIGNSKLAIEKGMTGATMNMYCGLHEFEDMGFLLHVLKPGDCFVDVGANVGTYTILASGVVGARTLAVEPIPSTYDRLLRNVDLNRLQEKVRAECLGIGIKSGETLRFIADQDTTNRIASDNYDGLVVNVPIKDMDSLVEDFPAVLWKIDVEGFEEQVIIGAVEALKSEKLLAVEMEGESEKISKIMRSSGFELYQYNPFDRKITSIIKSKKSHNWLWIRNIEVVSERCKLAPIIEIEGVRF